MKALNIGFGYPRHLATELIPGRAALSVPMKPWFLKLSSWKSIPRIPLPLTKYNDLSDLQSTASQSYFALVASLQVQQAPDKFFSENFLPFALFKPGLDHLQEIS